MGQHILFIMWPFNMYFAQICTLTKMSYGKTCPDLVTYAQLNSHARPYALSVFHSGWRGVLSYPYTYIVFYWKYMGNLVQSPIPVYIDTDIDSGSCMLLTFYLCLKV